VLDTGKACAKHQGGVSVGYRHQRVSVEGDLGEFDDDEPRILRGLSRHPTGIELTDEFDNDLSERFPGKKSASRMSPARSFHIETDGSFSVEELLLRAIDSIERRADELQTKVAV